MKKIKRILAGILLILSIFNVVFPYTVDASSKVFESVNQNDGGGSSKSKDFDISNQSLPCSKILGKNLTRLVKAGITIFQIACIIIALIKGMTILLPALMSKDADKGDKSTGQLIVLGIVLIIALIFRPIVALLGKILEFDVSCII